MSRGGMGYEISFAYTNFDNATMYPLILLILLVSITINGVLSRWEKVLLARRGHAMSGDALEPLRNAVVLIVGLLVALAVALPRRRRRGARARRWRRCATPRSSSPANRSGRISSRRCARSPSRFAIAVVARAR